MDLISKFQNATCSVITEKNPPSIQNTLGRQENGFSAPLHLLWFLNVSLYSPYYLRNTCIVEVLHITRLWTPPSQSQRLQSKVRLLIPSFVLKSVQTLMIRPVSTTALAFDGKSEKIELLENIFHKMMKMQPDMTETIKINHFFCYCAKMRCNLFATFILQKGNTRGFYGGFQKTICQTRVPSHCQT